MSDTYSRFQLAQKYARYYLTASNGKGHGIHSPFVYDLVRRVLNDARHYPEYSPIEGLRRELEKNPTLLSIEDMGAGSALNGTRQRSIAEISRHAAKPKKLGQLLFRIARYYQAGTIVELGTSLGLSTAYLAEGALSHGARATGAYTGGEGVIGGRVGQADGVAEGAPSHEGGRVFTIEGASEVAAVAERNFRSLGLENIDLRVGNFDQVLERTLDEAGMVDLAFVDGNHRFDPTLRYFNSLISRSSTSSVLIFDDIHWSREMEEAWESIKQDRRVYLTIDLFFIGLVFLREEFKVKQDFIIRF